MAACVFHDVTHLEAAAAAIKECARHNKIQGEFKYSKTKDSIKDCFFRCIKTAPFSVRAISIQKTAIYSRTLLDNPSKLKSYAIRQILTKNFGYINDAKVFIDGQDTKAFDMEDSAYFQRMVNRETPGTIREIAWADSRQNVMIQLADMVAGAINRAERSHKPSSPKHLDTFRSRTWQPQGTLWRFR